MNRYLVILAFGAGAGTMGLEMAAARLLEPWFGTSQIVWAALIALVLGCLALGAWLGGRLGDRYPHLDGLLVIVLASGLATVLIPRVALPVLRATALDLLATPLSLLLAAWLAVSLLLGLPTILLGTISPWAIRLALPAVERGGHTVGRLYASATLGSILGTLLPVLWLIPAVGTRWTFHLIAAFLMLLVAGGALCLKRGRWRFALLGLLGAGAMALLGYGDGPAIRQGSIPAVTDELVYEDESVFNYIAVHRRGSETYLKLNEGVGIHSVHHPETELSLGVWDYFLLAPWFSRQPPDPAAAEVLVMGLAGGTVSSLWTDIYGPAPITGLELDPQILEVGRRYFQLDRPNVRTVATDGRRWLRGQPAARKWDVVLVDAYQVPYIPFHLTTVEFFQLVRAHLTEHGVVAINVGRTRDDQTLVDALIATMREVYPTVAVLREPVPPGTLGNALVVGLNRTADLATYRRHIQELSPDLSPAFRAFAERSLAQAEIAAPPPNVRPLTDDRADIERIVHGIVWRFLRGAGT